MNTKIFQTIFLLAASALLFTGCVRVYTMEIQQGNVVTQEMLDKLKPGMTRSQVRYVLGTPLVADPFHQDRWDFYYYLRPSNEKSGETRQLTVFFENDLLKSVAGEQKSGPALPPVTDTETE